MSGNRRLAALALLSCLLAVRARAEDASTPADAGSALREPEPTDSTEVPEPPETDRGAEESAPAPPAIGSGEEVSLTEEDLAQLGIEAVPAFDTSFHFSGFADFTFGTLLVPRSSVWRSLNTVPPHSSFYLGNINLYLSKELTRSLQMLGEVRLSYLPNGSVFAGNAGVGDRVSTTTSDYVDFGRPNRWGGIVIERFYLDWVAHPQLTVRLGQFLSPYGVWNVDHGSPTYIPIRRPWVVGSGYIPQRQTGIELFGRWDASDNSALGYHLTVSNGTGPLSEYWDLDENKAVGGRLFWEYRALGELRLGASAYYGRETRSTPRISLSLEGKAQGKERIDRQFDLLTFGIDVVWRIHGVHLQAEALVSQLSYTNGGRVAQLQPSGIYALPSDVLSGGGYLLAGYRLTWLGVMPYAMLEHISLDALGAQTRAWIAEGGLNVRPIDILVVKVAYQHIVFLDGIAAHVPLRLLQAQVAWAF